MPRLIDADGLWQDVIHAMDYCEDILEFIDNAPTVDAVEVVRCKDCVSYNGDHNYCYQDNFAIENGYCYVGEKGDE